MMQSVNVYLREGRYFVVTIHGSGGSPPSIVAGPVKELAASAPAAELGAAVRAGLAVSTHDMPYPTDFAKVSEPLLAAAQAKTWGAFAKRAQSVRVNGEGTQITLLPKRRTPKGSFEAAPGREQSLAAPDDSSLGALIASELAEAAHSK
jgi:hypothetical protein